VTDPQVVLFDEPTRGIDVGAKVAVYELMRTLAAEGKAVLMVSSELPEIIGMSDRILVMRDGELVAELPAGSAEHEVLTAATGSQETPDDVIADPRIETEGGAL
jgi:ribose transport system ATP-binding protein